MRLWQNQDLPCFSSVLYFLSFLKLFIQDPPKRLGMSGCESGPIRSQAFYKDINWESLKQTKIDPPFKPKIVRLHFISHFYYQKHVKIGSVINISASFPFLASNLLLFKVKTSISHTWYQKIIKKKECLDPSNYRPRS